jgi:DNA-binding response OmpR family regulator
MSNKRILIIDDDPDINNFFKLFLEHDGYKVNTLLTH